MAGVRAAGGGGGAVLALVLALLPPAPARATDPGGHAPLTLPEPTRVALTVDLDGDGAAEVVRLRDDADGEAVLDVWAYADGWTLADALTVEPIRIADGSPADAHTTGLLRWTRAGREELLLIAASTDIGGSVFPAPCCLVFSVLARAADGYRIERVPGGGGPGDTAMVVDLDADGTDEVVTQRTVFASESDPGNLELEVHRWRDGRFETTDRLSVEAAYGVVATETDGRPGQELLLLGTIDRRLIRWSMVDGSLERQETLLDAGQAGDGFFAGATDGRMIMSDGMRAVAIRWPYGGQAEVGVEWPITPGAWIQVIGSGADALVYAEGATGRGPMSLPGGELFTMDGRSLGSVPVSPATERVWPILAGAIDGSFATTRQLWPYSGPVPLSRGLGYLTGGTLIVPHGANGFETLPFGPLIDAMPVGRAGPDDRWLVLHDGTGGVSGDGTIASLWSFDGPGDRHPLTLVPDEVLTADPADAVRVSLTGAVQLEDGSVYAARDGLELVVDAPPGSAVASTYLGVKVVREVGERPATIRVRPPRNAAEDQDQEFAWEGVVILPDGRAAPLGYSGIFVREALLRATAVHEPLSLRASIGGETRPGATVSVDGRPVEVDADGQFVTAVDAPPWPRTVVVTARDPLGDETTTTVEVIGLVDYRGLPWALVFGTGTVAAGAFLYLRTPRQPSAASPVVAEGTLEEIDGD